MPKSALFILIQCMCCRKVLIDTCIIAARGTVQFRSFLVIRTISACITPFMPKTTERILLLFGFINRFIAPLAFVRWLWCEGHFDFLLETEIRLKKRVTISTMRTLYVEPSGCLNFPYRARLFVD